MNISVDHNEVKSAKIKHFINRPYLISLKIEFLNFQTTSDYLKEHYARHKLYNLADTYSYHFDINAYKIKSDKKL